MKILAVAAGLAVGGLTALTPSVAHAQQAKACANVSPTNSIPVCTLKYATAHPSHDAYYYGPMHLRGRTGETFSLVGGIPGDKYELQYCNAGKWSSAARATVGTDRKVELTADFSAIPRESNSFRLQNTSVGITSWTLRGLGSDYYPEAFSGTSAACGTGATKAPATKTPAAQNPGGLAKTGF